MHALIFGQLHICYTCIAVLVPSATSTLLHAHAAVTALDPQVRVIQVIKLTDALVPGEQTVQHVTMPPDSILTFPCDRKIWIPALGS